MQDRRDPEIDEINRARDLARVALAALKAKKLKKAIRLAAEASELAVTEAAPHEIMIEALTRQGKRSEAEAAARGALAVPLLGFHPNLILQLGRLLIERGDARGGLDLLRRSDHLPVDPELAWECARAAALVGSRLADVLLRMERAVTADPSRRPRQFVEEPAFARHWQHFIASSSWVWVQAKVAEDLVGETRTLVAELVELAGERARANNVNEMYGLLEVAAKHDRYAAGPLVRATPALRPYWRELRMRMLIPRSAFDVFRFWD